ncbi:hypothetical protein F3Y22_tig00110356pilonHSYRG00171 [Hibiscus syriacus]|uniref:BEACH domain-containing protein n=1 Tax=Hibiscus syriacus TaxID=106335 RepID=A0A6A3AYW0_HIBSY|nr:hypothetical protein F3Y22_tig00110356pilonHSYRG00171 [Hibiscus syriacus]
MEAATLQVSNAVAPPQHHHSLITITPPPKSTSGSSCTTTSIPQDVKGETDELDKTAAVANQFSFTSTTSTSQLVLERIMSQSEVSPLTPGRLSHSSEPLVNDNNSPPVSPSEEFDDVVKYFRTHNSIQPLFNGGGRASAGNGSNTPNETKSVGRWLKERKEKKIEETRAHNAQIHAAISVAAVASAIAAIAAAATASSSSSSSTSGKNEQSEKKDMAVESALTLVAAQCVEAAEAMGAERDHLASVVSSAVNVRSPDDIVTLTAAAATALRGAATLKARAKKEVRNVTAVLMAEKGISFAKSNNRHSNGNHRGELDTGEDCLSACNQELIAKGCELLKRTRKGDLHWKVVSVYVDKAGQVILKMKSKHVAGTFTKKNKKGVSDVVLEVCKDMPAWPGRHLFDDREQRYYFGLKTETRGVVEFECRSQREYYLWTRGVSRLLSIAAGRKLRPKTMRTRTAPNTTTVASPCSPDGVEGESHNHHSSQNHSDNLDLSDPKSFRKLEKPMGCQTLEGEEEFKTRYESWDDPEVPKFHYGSHYSSAGIVLFYLLRLSPFNVENQKLQGGQFDHADCLFSSISDTWLSAAGKGNTSDVKELIPKFFYMPEFLENTFSLDLGEKQSGEKAAEKVANVFYHYTYEGSVDIDAVRDPSMKASILAQINHFGQTPKQLFLKPHVKRRSDRKLPPHPLKTPTLLVPHEIRKSSNSITHIVSFQEIVLIGKANTKLKPRMYSKSIAWGFPDLSLRFLSFDQDRLLSTHENLHLENQTQCAGFSHDGHILVTGTDNALVYVWRIIEDNPRTSSQLLLEKVLCAHRSKITCLHVSQSYMLIVSGSDDCTAIIWDLSSLRFVRQLPEFPAPVSAVYVNDLTGEIMTAAGTLLAVWSINGCCLAVISPSQIPSDYILSTTSSTFFEWLDTNCYITGHHDGTVKV